jgi:hypothetical protein
VPARYLPIYLGDHLFGVIGGVELCRRALRENDGSDLGTFLQGLLTELREDRDSLVRLIRTLGLAPSLPKAAAAWTAEKLGRLKLNGELTRYSPLSRLVELDGLAAGIEAKKPCGSPSSSYAIATSVWRRFRSTSSPSVRARSESGSSRTGSTRYARRSAE